MRKIFYLCLAFFVFAVISESSEDKDKKRRRRRQISALDDETYDTIYKLCSGTFDIPVKKRTNKQRAAFLRFWRNKGAFCVRKVGKEKVLLFKGKRVLKKNEIKAVVEEEFKYCKGVGSRKLRHRLKKQFVGISEPRIQQILGDSSLSQQVNARFSNKAISRPVRASGIQVGWFVLQQ